MSQSQDNIQRLYAATDGGLRIICDYCQAAREAVAAGNPQKRMFAYSHERTPSAHLWKGQDHWVIKDFSSSSAGADDPIAVFCKAEGYNRKTEFNKVMRFLCQKYLGEDGVQTISEKNRAVWDDPVPAPDDMREGEYRWEGLRPLNEREREIMGRYARESVFNDLRWYAIEAYGRRKDGKIKWCHATETYPIFLRECVVKRDGQKIGSFWKKYEPLNPDKGFRFLTFDNDGIKPADYVNNLQEYHEQYNKAKAAMMEDGGEDIPEMLSQGVVICSGERDAIACYSMGWWPIWFNSETAQITPQMIRRIKGQNPKLPIYYIPDLDDTGTKVRNKIANQYPDIWIVELPEELKQRRDNRGKPMKDLRDWVESTPDMGSYKFDRLMQTAVRVKFWDVTTTKNGDRRVSIDSACLHFFLRTNGIEPVRDEAIEGDVEFGHHVSDYIIEAFNPKDVTDYVLSWAQRNLLPREVMNALLDGVKLDGAKLMKMVASAYSFVHHDQNSQTIYFRDRYAVITEKGIDLMEPKAAGEGRAKIWRKSVIDRPFRFITHDEERPMLNRFGKPLLDKDGKERRMIASVRTKLFHYTRTEAEDGTPHLAIDIHPDAYRSPAFRVLCATSHIFWQTEQQLLESQGKGKEEIAAYWRDNWYRIDSPLLSPVQVYEQRASLISKLFIIGYYGWDFNSPSSPWAAYLMDDFDGEGSNGGSGKSLLFTYINQYKSVVTINGRDKNNASNKFVFADVNSRTRVILFDDFWGNFSDWYQPITSGVRVERKSVDPFTIPLEKSPKLAFTTNGVGDQQQSSQRRQIRCTCSSFFHTEGGQFQDTVTPADFVGTLWDVSYGDDNWRYDDNIFLECIEEAMPYIKRSIKIEPPMQRVELRKLRTRIGKANIEFFDDYFQPGMLSHADCFIDRHQFVEDYRKAIKGKAEYITETDLLERLAKWVAYRPWVLSYCPKGVPGWCGGLKGEYRHARIIQNGVEGIYIATSANTDPRLSYLKEATANNTRSPIGDTSAGNAEGDLFQNDASAEDAEVQRAVDMLSDPLLADQPL